jgi:hypothetical protein
MAPPTPFDSILPTAAAFFDGADKLQANQIQYPKFTAANCGWHAIFERIAQPALLWDCWGPGSLGEYPDVLTLWKSWDEGMMIEGVGQQPPLRRVDEQWGCHRDTRSKKGHLAAWRPRNDENVGGFCSLYHFTRPTAQQARRKWSQYQFFIKHIEESVAKGMPALQAIRELDGQRGSRSLPKLHRELQPKGRKRKHVPATSSTVVAAAGSADNDGSTAASLPPPEEY